MLAHWVTGQNTVSRRKRKGRAVKCEPLRSAACCPRCTRKPQVRKSKPSKLDGYPQGRGKDWAPPQCRNAPSSGPQFSPRRKRSSWSSDPEKLSNSSTLWTAVEPKEPSPHLTFTDSLRVHTSHSIHQLIEWGQKQRSRDSRGQHNLRGQTVPSTSGAGCPAPCSCHQQLLLWWFSGLEATCNGGGGGAGGGKTPGHLPSPPSQAQLVPPQMMHLLQAPWVIYRTQRPLSQCVNENLQDHCFLLCSWIT